MSTITPHRDAAERAIATMLKQIAEQGEPPDAPSQLAKKITVKTQKQVFRATADAQDRGMSREQVAACYAQAMGLVTLSMAGSLGGGRPDATAMIFNHIVGMMARIGYARLQDEFTEEGPKEGGGLVVEKVEETDGGHA